MGFECVARTHVGLRRTLNEDALLNSPENGIWAVADGMGGHDAGEVASAMVIEALSRITASETGMSAAVSSALEQVNLRLVELGRQGGEQRTIGSTVVTLLASGSAYSCIWAGDSRAYLIRNGEIVRVTRDHSLVQELVDAGLLDEEQADRHPNANVITRAIGAADLLELESRAGDLAPGDVFLLASDGLTRSLLDRELLALGQIADLDAAAEALLARALERGGADNITLVLIRVC